MGRRQDLKGDHIRELRQLNRVAPERYEEQRRRGYDIIDGRGYGPGAKETGSRLQKTR